MAVLGPDCQFELGATTAPSYQVGTIPNIFTPNLDDTLNPTFVVPDLPAGTRLQVFTRWGRLVYHSEHYANDWAAEGLSDGLYYYLLENPRFCQGSQVRGWVEVRR